MIGFTLASIVLLQTSAESVPETKHTPLHFSVTHDGSVAESLDGRVYIMLTQGHLPPIGGPNWWRPEPFFAVEVQDWKTGEVLVLDDSADAMHGGPSTLEQGAWKAVAVYRPNTERSLITTQGGAHSEVLKFDIDKNASNIEMLIQTVVPDRDWPEHKNLRLVHLKSPMLSEFHGKEITHGACVIVPDEYDPTRAEPYPVLYWIGGFGSDHYGGRMMKAYFTASDYDDQVCRVILNAQTYSGHHVFADSANNGPRMTAFIEEFIPYLEDKYNLGGSPEKRFLAGHSSGGWASMWLQIQNPDFFNGVWSLAPDPLDFHHFNTTDLYAENANMYTDNKGMERPLARQGTSPVLFTRGFTAMDDVILDGGQIGSFEWVFSPKGENGRPVKMFDRETGEVQADVVAHWQKYDIRKILEENWEELSPKLSGKINIVAGGIDTFYLEQPVIELNTMFKEREFDAMIRVIENGDHGSVFRTSVIRDIDEYIARTLNLPHIQFKKTIK